MKNPVRNFALAGLLLAAALFGQKAQAAETTFLQLSGITGEVTQAGRQGWLEVYGFSHEVVSPRDAASGLPTGKRQHKPFRMVLVHSGATIKLYEALVQNSAIPTASITFWKPTSVGAEINYYKIELQNVRVSSIRAWQPNKADRTAADYPQMVEVEFVYQKIIWTYQDGGVTAEDTWSTPN